jgi:hypothetical protein
MEGPLLGWLLVDEIKAGRTGCIEESQEDIEVEPLNV